jgi:hypothetical protein
MKITMADLLIIRQGLNEYGKLTPPLAKVALAMARIGKKLKPELEAMAESEMALLKKYCSMDKDNNPIRVDGGGYDIPDENWNDFEAEKKALLETEIDVDITPIKWLDIENTKGITSLMIELLDKVIEFE